MNPSLDVYLSLVEPARERFARWPALRTLLDPATPPELLELFLVHYCARGVQMTEPVEGWIRAAGQRCLALGEPAVGKALLAHAGHEAGHHELFVTDVCRLVARWNRTRLPMLDAERLLAEPATPAIHAYVALHQATIASEAPWGQVAIEYEIERLSVAVGGPLLARLEQALGRDLTERLSFLSEHVALDAGHTQLNQRMLGELLAARPAAAERLARTGAAALEAYAGFLAECLAAAREVLARAQPLAQAQA